MKSVVDRISSYPRRLHQIKIKVKVPTSFVVSWKMNETAAADSELRGISEERSQELRTENPKPNVCWVALDSFHSFSQPFVIPCKRNKSQGMQIGLKMQVLRILIISSIISRCSLFRRVEKTRLSCIYLTASFSVSVQITLLCFVRNCIT